LRSVAVTLLNWALPAVLEFTSPRAWCFTLLGIRDYLRRFAGDRTAQSIGKQLLDRLMVLYQENDQPDWHWFEPQVTYCNSVLPHALLSSWDWLGDQKIIDTGLEAQRWLIDLQRSPEGYFSPIGSNGFYFKDREKAIYDQQPVEASTAISACLEAYRLTGDRFWRQEAQRCFQWFLGANTLGLSLYDPTTGGCRDGLHPDRANQNQGAESTLAFLEALLLMQSTQSRFKLQNSHSSSVSIRSIRTEATKS
jgi:hypothetical protein